MSDIYRDELEACSHLSELVLTHSGVSANRIFFPNMRQMAVGDNDEWMNVAYIVGTSGVSLFAGPNSIKRTSIVQELMYFERIGTGTANSGEVYRRMNAKYNGYASKSLTYLNKRRIMRDIMSPIPELLKTHKVAVISYSFSLDFLE